MKPKQLIILGVVLAVLVVAVIIRKQIRPAELSTEVYTPLNFSFDPEAVAKIDIAKPKTKIPGDEEYVDLVKKSGHWHVATMVNARADEKKISSFLNEIKGAKGEVRGNSQSLFPDFKIGDGQAYRVTLTDVKGKEILSFHIGLKKAGGDGVFVRRKGSSTVYLTEAYLFGRMGVYSDPAKQPLDTNYWVSMVMFDFQAADVTALQTTRFDGGSPQIAASVSRLTGSENWTYTRNDGLFAIDGNKVLRHLDSLKTWRAQSADDKAEAEYGFDKPTWEMKITLKDGSQIVATAGKPNAEKRYVPIRVSTEPVIYRLSGYYFENMDIDDSRFFKDNPLDINPDQTKRLVIRAGKQNFDFDAKAVKKEAVKKYLEDLKSFRVKKLLFDSADRKKVKSPGEYYFEIFGASAAKPVIIDAGKKVSESSHDYVAALRGGALPFELDGSLYKKLFENLDRLNSAPAK